MYINVCFLLFSVIKHVQRLTGKMVNDMQIYSLHLVLDNATKSMRSKNSFGGTCRSTSGRSLSSFCWQSPGRTEKVCLLMIARKLVLTKMESGVSTSMLHLVRLNCPAIQNRKQM